MVKDSLKKTGATDTDAEVQQTAKSQGELAREAMKPLYILFGAAVILITAILGLATAREESPSSLDDITIQQSSQPLQVTVQTEADEPDHSQSIPGFAMFSHSLNTNGALLSLQEGQENWLTRSRSDWERVARWGDWLIFASRDRSENENNLDSTVHGFNITTREYLTGTDVALPTLGTAENPFYLGIVDMQVYGDYLYIGFDEYKAAGEVQRCKLDEQNFCSQMEPFYSGSGSIEILNDTTVYAYDTFGDAGIGLNSISLFNPATNQKSDIISLESVFGIGTNFADVDNDGNIWIVEQDGDTDNFDTAVADETRRLTRIFAVDAFGNEVISVPADLVTIGPDVELAYSQKLEDGAILLASETQEVIFYINDRVFSEPRSLTSHEERSLNDDMITEKIAQRLMLPSSYTLVNTNEDI